MIFLRIIAAAAGPGLIGAVLMSAIRTFVLPRSARDRVTQLVFRLMRLLFRPFTHSGRSYAQRDEALALFAPVSLLVLPGVWLVLVGAGYTGLYWALGLAPGAAALLSGSSLFTLGFRQPETALLNLLVFTESGIGLLLVALLIAYLPTMYAAFSRRETAVTMLEVRAGSPPSAVELIARFHRLQRFDHLHELWEQWEQWFAELDESHTSLAVLVFFRSPRPDHSWVTAAGTILDAAALTASTLDIPRDAQTNLCIRAGYLALRHIADFFGLRYDAAPRPDDPISVTRADFEAVYEQLRAGGVPLQADRDQAWRDFAGWRVNYDTVLLALARLTTAPSAPWVSDEPRRRWRP